MLAAGVAGSMLSAAHDLSDGGLGLALEAMGKHVTLHCADGVPEPDRFLPRAGTIRTDAPGADVDLVVTVDFGTLDRAKFALPKGPRIVDIDHHASNDRFGDVKRRHIVTTVRNGRLAPLE